MDFDLGEEDQLLRDTVRQLCEQRVQPHAGAWDEARAIPEDLRAELGQMGLWAMERPEDEGGAGLTAVAATALLEELAAADGALALLVMAHNVQGLAHVAAELREPMRARVLPEATSGARLVAWALPEAARGPEPSDATLAVEARRDGDGWRLEGHARHVLGAAVAGWVVVFGCTEAGPTAFVLPTDAEGLAVSDPVRTLGARAAGTAHLQLRGVRVADEQRLGEPGAALVDARAHLRHSRLGAAAVACGLLRGALQQAAAYAQEREQFGRPIARFQAIQWKLADMATTLDAAWLSILRGAWQHDQGQADDEAAARARVWATHAAVQGCSEALQIHGGYGYTREYPVERALRDARWLDASEGGRAAARLWVAQAIAERFGG